MDDAIRQAIADLSALIKDADSEDAKRIRRIIRRLQKYDADAQCSLVRWTPDLRQVAMRESCFYMRLRAFSDHVA